MPSGVAGVNRLRVVSGSSTGVRLIVGRWVPVSETSGRMDVNVLKMTLELLGFGERKNGRASAVASTSYWAAMDATSSRAALSL
jgi:hypothetical protein